MKHIVSRLVPEIFCSRDVHAATDLIAREGPGSFYLSELLALLAMPGVSREQRLCWANALAGQPASDDLGLALGTIGVFAFSFPIWRFLADRTEGEDGSRLPALLESFGMERIVRASDNRFGVGFVSRFPSGEIEYRRAYVRVSLVNGGHLLIRNSSHYWGRDRLPHAAYFSPGDAHRFKPIPFAEWPSHAMRLRTLTDTLIAFEDMLSHWFFDGQAAGSGFPALLKSLSVRLKIGKPLFLGFIHPDHPPWCPYAALQATEDVLSVISRHGNGMSCFFEKGLENRAKLVLMSGERGDFPVRE